MTIADVRSTTKIADVKPATKVAEVKIASAKTIGKRPVLDYALS